MTGPRLVANIAVATHYLKPAIRSASQSKQDVRNGSARTPLAGEANIRLFISIRFPASNAGDEIATRIDGRGPSNAMNTRPVPEIPEITCSQPSTRQPRVIGFDCYPSTTDCRPQACPSHCSAQTIAGVKAANVCNWRTSINRPCKMP